VAIALSLQNAGTDGCLSKAGDRHFRLVRQAAPMQGAREATRRMNSRPRDI